jgi:hypothetical protein
MHTRIVLVALVALAALLFACQQSDAPATPLVQVAPPLTATPDSRAYVYDVDTLERVYDVAGLGRVPLGLINTVAIDRANAWFGGFYAGEDLPSARLMGLSVITWAQRDALVTIDGRSYVSYEWWFSIVRNVDATGVAGEPEPDLRLAIREVNGGDWAVYADAGSGWVPVEGAAVEIGEYEVSARVPLQESWGMNLLTTRTFFRALTREEGWLENEQRNFGWVYPEDLTWREVLSY